MLSVITSYQSVGHSYLLNACCVPGPAAGANDTALNKIPPHHLPPRCSQANVPHPSSQITCHSWVSHISTPLRWSPQQQRLSRLSESQLTVLSLPAPPLLGPSDYSSPSPIASHSSPFLNPNSSSSVLEARSPKWVHRAAFLLDSLGETLCFSFSSFLRPRAFLGLWPFLCLQSQQQA